MEEDLMKLAGSSYWQTLYKASKECNGIRLFDNETNFSAIQSDFLFWLKAYDLCIEEINNKTYEFLDYELLEDPVRVKAFLYYRKTQLDKKLHEYKKEEKKNLAKKGKANMMPIYKGPLKKK